LEGERTWAAITSEAGGKDYRMRVEFDSLSARFYLQTSTTTLKKVAQIGPRPTVAEIDGFISRTASQLDYDKSAKGITRTTNAERIIKGSL
jgi:hypothetical protein